MQSRYHAFTDPNIEFLRRQHWCEVLESGLKVCHADVHEWPCPTERLFRLVMSDGARWADLQSLTEAIDGDQVL